MKKPRTDEAWIVRYGNDENKYSGGFVYSTLSSLRNAALNRLDPDPRERRRMHKGGNYRVVRVRLTEVKR